MPRGGRRPGAGRPKKSLPEAVAHLSEFDLLPRLVELSKDADVKRRAVLALAAFDAPTDVIAAVVGGSEECVSERYEDEMRTGHVLLRANLLRAVWAFAEAGRLPAIMLLLRRSDAVNDRQQKLLR